ncbi:MAG: CxxxxCH/CxxCH domain-containing protein [Geobacter sp.]|nr:CxxxxCH/CxxCH domain-containing protein [Geobacter sp.]
MRYLAASAGCMRMFRLKPGLSFACQMTLFLLVLPFPAAAIECYQCHGSSGSADYRPLDAPYRNITSGGFQGNHRTHMAGPASAAACAACHPGAAAYGPSHRNSLIELSPNINDSPLAAVYRNGSTAFPQRTAPRLGSCSNVNCHFERQTPIWGSQPFTAPGSCSQCHGAPPQGGASGLIGSHTTHNNYYGGIDKCRLCHADNLGALAPFAHATSAGRRPLIVTPHNPAGVPGGTYAGPLDDYLPSSPAKQFGSCSMVYCHSTVQSGSDGTGPPVYGTPTWGAATGCKGCHAEIDDHGGIAADGERWIATGNHRTHNAYRFDTYGSVIVKCTMCHSWTLGPLGGGCGGRCHTDNQKLYANHANGKVDVVFKPEFTVGSYSGSGIPRSGFGNCSNTYCHSNGSSVATGSIPANTTVRWGSPTLACNGCHGYPPAYANGSPKANKHGNHSFGCNVCHSATTSDGATIIAPGGYYGIENHVDKAYTVVAGGGASFTYAFATTGGSCTSISCHQGGNASWGSSTSHAAELGTGVILMGLDNSDHGTGFGIEENCSLCHYASLAAQHANNCALCHAGANLAGSLIGSWNRTCQQGACHPSFHTEMTGDHNGIYWDSSSSCALCHDTSGGDFPGPGDNCLRCHNPSLTAAAVGDHLPPTTVTDALALYVGPGVIHLTATDAGTSGVSLTRFSLDGKTWVLGNAAYFSAPTSGSRSHTLQFYSTDHAMNIEAVQTITFVVQAAGG